MSYTTDLLVGIAADLADLGVGVWRPDGPEYTATERGITLRTLPENPPEVVAIANYAYDTIGTYRRDEETVVTYVQIRLRVLDADDGDTLQEQIRDRYHRRTVNLQGESQALRVTGRQVSRGPLPPDENERFLFTQNFTFTGLRARTA